jgi:iron complex outermembrane receptor protein
MEKRFNARWKLDYGVRLDDSSFYGRFVSPRAAIEYQPSAKSVYKLIYGRPFRNPSANEQFYYDNIAFLKAPPLKAEEANTFDFTAEHHFKPNLSGLVSVYYDDLDRLIQAAYLDNGASQFVNTSDSHTRGAEVELSGKPKAWLDMTGSFTWQRADISEVSLIPNSPARLAKLRWSVPVGRRITAAASVQYMSSRWTYAGSQVRPVLLAGVTLTVRHILPGCDLQAGVRNALNWAYDDPAGLSLDRFPGDPRSYYMKLVWHPAK